MTNKALVIVLFALLVVVPYHEAFNKSPMGTKQDTFSYIKGKLSEKPVSAVFQPVTILQYSDNDAERAGNSNDLDASFTASGTMVKLSNGNCVITAEHVFSKHKDFNYSHSRYVVSPLRGNSANTCQSIVSARPFFKDRPGLIDVAVCMLGSDRRLKIQPFSPIYGHNGPSRTDQFYAVKGKPNDLIVQSVVSGEEARLILGHKIPHTNARCFLIDYKSFPGESGTGFVDRRGNLYVLKGSSNDAGYVNALLKGDGVIREARDGYSLIVGPFDLNGFGN